MTKCWFCGNEMVWQSEFSFEDYGIEGDGSVAILKCFNENCGAIAKFKIES